MGTSSDHARNAALDAEPAAQQVLPRWITDLIGPLLSAAESAALAYVWRRAAELGDAAAPVVLSAEEIARGRLDDDGGLIDLGIQRTPRGARNAIHRLQQLKLIEVGLICASCEHAIDTGERSCSECGGAPVKTLAVMAPDEGRIAQLLNELDREGRSWSWDPDTGRYLAAGGEEGESTEERRARQLAEIDQLRERLWYPELVDECVRRAERQLSGGRMSPSRQLKEFYQPVMALQEEHNAPAIRHALTRTIAYGVLDQPKTANWVRYLRKVAENAVGSKGGQSGSDAGDIESRQNAMYKLLTRAAQLNATGKRDEARVMLSDIIAESGKLAPLFDGDAARCEQQLRLAFKQGTSEFIGLAVDPYAPDYYPEWDPTEDPTASAP